jgi:hypothetical protein
MVFFISPSQVFYAIAAPLLTSKNEATINSQHRMALKVSEMDISARNLQKVCKCSPQFSPYPSFWGFKCHFLVDDRITAFVSQMATNVREEDPYMEITQKMF